jgi:hypothetical protein
MSSSTARTEKGQEHDRLAPYPRRRASVGSRLWPWAGEAGWGGRIGGRQGRRTRHPTTAKTMVRVWCEISSWTCKATARVGVGRIHGGGACSYALYREYGVARRWRHEGRERKEVEWRTRWWQLRRGPSLSWGGMNDQMSRVWRAVPRHDPFNSAWANPSRAACDAWPVASVYSADLVRRDYFFILQKKHMYNLYSIL